MAGGTFSSMNKVRPGAYINFVGEPEAVSYLGERGIATMPMALSFGEQGKLIEVTGNDMLNATSLAKIGLVSTDAEALPINLVLQNCETIKLFNTYKAGTKATVTIGANVEEEIEGLKITAKYPGTFGNKIAVVIKNSENIYTVETYANGYFADSQTVATIAELKENDFVTFSGSGTLQATASTLLTGGTNGTAMEASEYLPQYFNLLKTSQFNTLGILSTTEADKTSVINFIRAMRENEGKYVQGVVFNAANADYEGIINTVNGVTLEDGTEINGQTFVAWVTGATAGAAITESLTGRIVDNAVSIINPLDNEGIIEGLQNGKFILSFNQDGTIKVEKDINSLHTFADGKTYMFSKNRVIRELDEIGSGIRNIWEQTYLGKVSADEAGRTLFKSSIIGYLTELRDTGAIQDFDTAGVIVEEGNSIDSVVASIAIKPIDSMEFLYMIVNVS